MAERVAEELREKLREDWAKALSGLAGGVVLAARDHTALAAEPGSAWFATLDAALALEALSHPALHARHGALCASLVDFLAAMEAEGAPRGQAGPARIRIASDEPRRFHIETPSHVFTGDLWQGALRQALRAAPSTPVATHGGNLVSFRYGGRAHRLDVEDAIAACGIERIAGGVRLFHESRIMGHGWLDVRRHRLGTLRYIYEIRADTPVVTLSVVFQAEPGVVLRGLRLSTALDAMSPRGAVRYDSLCIGADTRHEGFARTATMIHTGPAEAIALVQRAAPSRALAMHVRPRAPQTLQGVSITGTAEGAIHWALMLHGDADLAAGACLSVSEDRLLLTGDPRPDLAALFARATPERGRDIALCPMPGMVAHALAMHFLWVRDAGGADTLARILAALRGALLHSADAARRGMLDLAFLLLTEDALLRRDGAAHRAAHGATLDVLLACEQDGFGDNFADHAAVLLALCRAVTLRPDDARLAPAIARAILAIRREDAQSDLDRALLHRALRAAQAARAAGALVLEEEAREQSSRMMLWSEAWLRDGAAPANATATAARLLAVLAPDALVMRVMPPS